jgi:hypothetical protein
LTPFQIPERNQVEYFNSVYNVLYSSVLILAWRRRTTRLYHFLRPKVSCCSLTSSNFTYPDHLRANLGDRFILSKRDIGEKRSVAGDGGVCVALDVGAPFPAGRVWVTSADVFRLEALEFLLGAEFVGLALCQHLKSIILELDGAYHVA